MSTISQPPAGTDAIAHGQMPEDGVRVKIVGIGGAGTNAVDRLQLDNCGLGLRIAALNTDAQSLNSSPAPEKLLIGRSLTRGVGTGG